MTTHIKVNCIMRNNQWAKHQKVFETIKITKKLVCPSGHRQNLLLKFENGVYSYDGLCWQANKFLNDIKENDIVLLYDRQYKEALVLKITSIPIKDKINDLFILRNKTCNIHTPVSSCCANCNNSIEMVFSSKYFEDNSKQFTKYINENFWFENMYGIFRNIEIIGKINTSSEIYHKHKTLQSSIGIPKHELLLPIGDIIPI